VRELGVGIVGCGVISATYMQNMPLFHGIKLVACADMRADVANAQAAAYKIPALPIDTLLKRDDVDIIVNLTPPNAHFEVSHAALTAGKHVFSEKPLCAMVAHGHTLVAEAKARNLSLGCAPDTFLGAGGRLARAVIDEGRIGRILSGSCVLMSHGMEHWHPDPEFFYKPGGGPILDIGPYYLAALVNLLGPVAKVQARASTGFAERLVSSQGPRTGHRIKVETPTTVMALLGFANGVDIMFTMSWDVWKHGHPPIELYGSEGSMRVPDPNFFGGAVEICERAGDWLSLDSSGNLYGKPNWRSPFWGPQLPDRANYRCLGIADMASAITKGTPQRASGALACHVLDVMHAILEAGIGGGTIAIASQIARPAPLSDTDAARYWRGTAN
jgi:predicted dehydrogenase